jgi:hypothetical protein
LRLRPKKCTSFQARVRRGFAVGIVYFAIHSTSSRPQ